MVSFKSILLLSAFVATTLAAKVREGRQFVPTDITGEYGQFVKQGSCSSSVTLKSVSALAPGAYSVSHADIAENGIACTGEGNFTIITKEVIITSGNGFILDTPPLKKVVNALDNQGATFMLGFERDPRVCGSAGTSANSIAIFIEEEKKINIPGLITLFPGAKYMIVYEPSSPTPCTYYSKVPERVIGIPATPAPATPQPTTTPQPTEEIAEPSSESATEADKDIAIAPVTTGSTDDDSADDLSGATTIGGLEEGEETAEPSASPEDDGSVCFPADATVEVEDGSVKRMEEIELGDRVKVASGEFSPVFMFTHKTSGFEYSFVHLTTSSGASLSLTKGHYLYVNGQLAAAKTVRVGDSVEVDNGLTTVSAVSTVSGRGLYNPQTVQGDIVVNGVRASTYTTTVETKTAHSLLAPLRAIFRVCGMTTSALDNGADRLAQVVPSGGLTV